MLKINEVEALVGITKKNIRFYEQEGLLNPRRNSENGYRDYQEEDVEALQRIKLLRKLGLPLEEIRKMQSGAHTISDGMRRHLVTLEREIKNLEQATELCASLQEQDQPLSSLDAGALLVRLEEMEREGTTFMDKQKNDTKRIRYVAPVVIAVLMTVLMGALVWLFVWAAKTDPHGAPPMPLLALLIAIPVVVILGVVLAMILRIREIGKGEEDDARNY
ncbi:MerR family transcriptional regulator [Oscillibacter hominis]|uniref:MerR family transcriptional regulator n=1 Tax=Oscillibacter hominis TaxID=2763056 RepID=UPI001FAD9335|nr:MerR family transcriptional regulator [Oscillibacter hominis]